MTDFLAEKRREISDRLATLKPHVEEYRRLEAAATALAGIPTGTGPGTRAAKSLNGRRRPGGRRTSSRSATHTAATAPPSAKVSGAKLTARRRGGRRRGSGSRPAEALAVIQRRPGITIPQIAEEMGIKQNYLYRVLPGLGQEGKLVKKGRGWHPKNTTLAEA